MDTVHSRDGGQPNGGVEAILGDDARVPPKLGNPDETETLKSISACMHG